MQSLNLTNKKYPLNRDDFVIYRENAKNIHAILINLVYGLIIKIYFTHLPKSLEISVTLCLKYQP